MTDRNSNARRTEKAIEARRLTQDEFIRRCIKKHGETYDYSKAVYINSATNVEIVCKKCQKSFFQLPSNHWKGYRCTHCYGKKKLTTEEFIRRAESVHGRRYSYEKTQYKSNRKKVCITCPTHGDFYQVAGSHWKGHGCDECAIIERQKSISMGFDGYISRCKEVHQNKYQYDEKSYTKTEGLLRIKCPNHGWFEQNAKAHLHGKGCKQCGYESSGFDRSRFKRVCKKNNNGNGLFYVIKCYSNKEVFYKIGITSRTVKERYPSKGHIPYEYKSLYNIIGNSDYIHKLEARIHALLKEHHYTPSLEFKGSVYECFKTIKPVERLLKELSTTDQLQLIA